MFSLQQGICLPGSSSRNVWVWMFCSYRSLGFLSICSLSGLHINHDKEEEAPPPLNPPPTISAAAQPPVKEPSIMQLVRPCMAAAPLSCWTSTCLSALHLPPSLPPSSASLTSEPPPPPPQPSDLLPTHTSICLSVSVLCSWIYFICWWDAAGSELELQRLLWNIFYILLKCLIKCWKNVAPSNIRPEMKSSNTSFNNKIRILIILI